MKELSIKTSDTLSFEDASYRVISVNPSTRDIVVIQEEITRFNVFSLSWEEILQKHKDGKFVVTHAAHSAHYRNPENKKYKRNLEIIAIVNKAYAPTYERFKSYGDQQDLINIASRFNISVKHLREIIRKYLQSGLDLYSLYPKNDNSRQVKPESKKRGPKTGKSTIAMNSNYIVMDPAKFIPYATTQFEQLSIVNACYRKDPLGLETSPLSLALPELPDDARLSNLCTVKSPIAYSDIINASPVQQKRYIDFIEKKVRVFLPQTLELANKIYSTIVLSYEKRKILNEMASDIPFNSKNIIPEIERRVIGTECESTTGFYATGPSGCGKSTSVETATSFFPQVLLHDTVTPGLPFKQIVYIMVSCPHKSDFTQLYCDIGKAIDSALHNPKPLYQNYLTGSKHINLGTLNSRLATLIETFGIGIIIIDEAQDLSFNSQFANSVRQLINLSNSTKVGIGFVGTRFFDAYYHFDTDTLQTVRRVCHEINAGDYCEDFDLFKKIVKWVCEDYQIFVPKYEISKDKSMLDFLFHVTHGNIGILVQIWKEMNLEYLDLHRDPEFRVDKNYVINVIKNKLPHLIEASFVQDKYSQRHIESALDRNIKAIAQRYTDSTSSFSSTIKSDQAAEIAIVDEVYDKMVDLYKPVINDEAKIQDAVIQAYEELKKRHRAITSDNVKKEALKRIKMPTSSTPSNIVTAYRMSEPGSLDRNMLNGETIESILEE